MIFHRVTATFPFPLSLEKKKTVPHQCIPSTMCHSASSYLYYRPT